MRPDEKITRSLTPAQVELLDLFSHIEASTLYAHLNTVLQTSIGCFGGDDARPSALILDAWHQYLDLLKVVAILASEGEARALPAS